jgi:hypothetical protein
VVVYKLTIADTIEERILALQDVKRAMAKSALEGGKSAAKLTMADILALFRHDGHGPDVVDSNPTLGGIANLLHRDGHDSRGPGVFGRREEHPVFGRRW